MKDPARNTGPTNDGDRALRIGGPGRYTDQQLGSYVLGALIGRGGMGEVYEARHVGNDTPAAVKLLHAQMMDNPDHVNRFIREIEVAASINAENVVAVLQVGKTAGEVPFLAMERLHGHDLAQHLRRRLSIGKTVAIRQLGRGLAAAHSIVRRDAKPQKSALWGTGSGTSTRQGGRLLTKLPMEIDLVLAIGLAKDREERFETAEEFADALLAASKSELDQKWCPAGTPATAAPVGRHALA